MHPGAFCEDRSDHARGRVRESNGGHCCFISNPRNPRTVCGFQEEIMMRVFSLKMRVSFSLANASQG